MDGLACLDEIQQALPGDEGRDAVGLDVAGSDRAARCAGARARTSSKSVDPTDLPATLRQAIGGNVFSAVGVPETSSSGGARAAGSDRTGDLDPQGARPGPLERPDRQGALGQPADGEVPPHERLPQARRQEPRRGAAYRVQARAGRDTARPRLTDRHAQPTQAPLLGVGTAYCGALQGLARSESSTGPWSSRGANPALVTDELRVSP